MHTSGARRFISALAVSSMSLVGAAAYGQGSFFTSLSGSVVDSSGAVIPGADVKVRNNGTGEQFNTVSGSDGGFTIPSLPGGIYSVTVSLMGFKTATLNEVTLNAAVPASVKVKLEVGTLQENITVTGESSLVIQTQTPSIAANLSGRQIVDLPLSTRNALDSLTSLPGFNTSGTQRNSTINGLPKSAINITLDSMSIQDNFLKTSDGYFARLNPIPDSVEEVTVTMAGNTADSTSQGAVQIKFVTKSGTNDWRGTTYEYFRHDALNANTWFNNRDGLAKPQLKQYQQGIAQGGPIIRNRAFFFFNYEELRQPGTSTLNRTILTPAAAAGTFSYNASGTVRPVNLLQLAAANGQLATLDPTVAKILGDIRTATGRTGTVTTLTNPLVQQYSWQTPSENFNPSPTVRVDYDVSQMHRLTGSMNYRHINSTPDTTNNAQLPFPGFATTGSQQSTRWTTSESLRSTLTSSLVNEFRVGATGGATYFSPELTPSMWNGTGGVADQGGFRLNFNGACCGTGFALTNPGLGAARNAREASTKVVEDTATWIKGKHDVTLGGSMVQADVWLQNQTLVPTIGFGVLPTEPATAMFSQANFPGASAADLAQAQNLYAMLTGRITSLTADARITPAGDQYVPLGQSRAQGRMREVDFYGQDSWRVASSLTINAGVRYVLALPFYPTNNSYTTVTADSLYGISGVGNLFMPGTLTGPKPNFIRYPEGTYAYRTQKSNVAPSLGFAWQTPGQSNAIGRWILGSEEGDSVIRAGGTIAYQRPGMSDFTGVFGANQGILVSLNRDQNSGNLGTLPLLLRNSNQLSLPPTPAVTNPLPPTAVTNTVNMFDPNLQLPYSQTYSIGWQRKLGRDTAVEVRYVGSRHRNDWETVNINEINITNNGFLSEFRKAQANLQANMAAGKGNTFAYTGAPGTSPLPIFLAFLNGRPGSQAVDPGSYTGTSWTNSTNLGFLALQNPNPFGFASTDGTNGFVGNSTFRNNGVVAGLPANFFLANPDVLGGANLTTNFGGTRQNSVQIELRKRMSNGLQFSTSYAYGKAYITQRYGFTRPAEDILQAGQVGGVEHAFKANWLYELPFGRQRRFGSHAGAMLDALIGGWSFDGVARIQTGEQLDFGNVRLVGLTVDQFKDAIGLRVGPEVNGVRQLYILPQDILENTVKAFAVSATSPTGYSALGPPTGRYLAPANGPDCIEAAPSFGDCGIRSLVVNAPPLIRFDLSAVKRVHVRGSVNFEFRADFLNAFNRPYFNPVTPTGINPPNLQFIGSNGFVTTFTNPGGSTQTATPTTNATAPPSVDGFRLRNLLGDNTSRLIQLVWRVRW